MHISFPLIILFSNRRKLSFAVSLCLFILLLIVYTCDLLADKSSIVRMNFAEAKNCQKVSRANAYIPILNQISKDMVEICERTQSLKKQSSLLAQKVVNQNTGSSTINNEVRTTLVIEPMFTEEYVHNFPNEMISIN
uniref:Uncharacterized protein n=1 Tax=Caenorhabditis japonica TaxID=281687 RepID=A0A8R1DGS3_CAEJA